MRIATAAVITLVVIGIFHQRSVERRKMVNQAAVELIAEGSRLCRLIETKRIDNFDQIRRESRLKIAWIRWADAGPKPKARIERGPSGAVIVVALPVAYRDEERMIEIAAHLDRTRPSARRSTTSLQKAVHSTI